MAKKTIPVVPRSFMRNFNGVVDNRLNGRNSYKRRQIAAEYHPFTKGFSSGFMA